ncbi:hypothetical protein H8959_021822 [Pygathrix nigripes]
MESHTHAGFVYMKREAFQLVRGPQYVGSLAAVPQVGRRERNLRRPGKLAGARGAALSRVRFSAPSTPLPAPGARRGAVPQTTRSRGGWVWGLGSHCRRIRPQSAVPPSPEAAWMEPPLPVGAQPLAVSAGEKGEGRPRRAAGGGRGPCGTRRGGATGWPRGRAEWGRGPAREAKPGGAGEGGRGGGWVEDPLRPQCTIPPHRASKGDP